MDEGERFCRVCRTGEEPGAPLYKPCKCSGTISWIHQDCLESWLSVSRGHKCELCKHHFKWEKVYAAQAPSHLPPILIARHLLLSGVTVLQYFLRFLLVAFIWLGFMPYSVLWTWRGLFHLASGWGLSWHAAMQEIDWSAVGIASLFLPPGAQPRLNNTTTINTKSNPAIAATNFTIDVVKKGKEIITLNKSINGTIIKSSMKPKLESLEEAVKELLVVASKGVNAVSQAAGTASTEPPISPVPATRNATVAFWLPYSGILERHAPSLYAALANRWDAYRNILNIVAKDAFAGQIIVCCVIVSFIAVFLLREWVMANQPQMAPVQDAPANDIQRLQAEVARDAQERAQVANNLREHVEADIERLRNTMATLQDAAAVEPTGQAPPLPTPPLIERPQDMLHPEGLRHRRRHASAPPGQEDEGRHQSDSDGGGTATPRPRSLSPYAGRSPLRDASEPLSPQTIDNTSGQGSGVKAEEDDYGVRSEAESETEAGAEAEMEAAGDAVAPMVPPIQPAAIDGPPRAVPAFPGFAAAAAQRPGHARRPRDRGDGGSDSDSDDDNDPFVLRQRQAGGNADAAQALQVPLAAMEDEDDVFFEADLIGIFEAIGMQGPLLALLQNVALVTLLIACLLAITVWVPLMVGKTVTATNAHKLVLLPLNMVRYFTDPIADASVGLLRGTGPQSASANQVSYAVRIGELWQATRSLAAEYAGSMHKSVQPQSFLSRLKSLAGLRIEAVIAHIVNTVQQKLDTVKETWHAMAVGNSRLDGGLCIALGYVVILAGAGLYIRHSPSGPVREAGAAVRETIRQHLTLAKAAGFFFVEIIVFPTLCGFLINLATLPLIPGATVSTRIGYYLRAPISSIFLTWLAGTNFMFSFAQAISVVRKCIRKGVLYFIRDPSDPDSNPLREILETPTLQQAKKITRSLVVYGGIILTCFGCFPWLSRLVNFGIFPLRWDLTQPISTLPNDLLFMLLVAPWTTGHMKARRPIRKLVAKWCVMTAHQLRLSSFMLGKRRLDEEGTHIRRTWRAWLLLKKAPIAAGNLSSGRKTSSSRIAFPAVSHCTANSNTNTAAASASADAEVVFQADGGFARVVAADNVKIVAGNMFVRLKPDGTPETEEGVRAIKAQTEKGINDESKFTVVYLPPHFKARILLFIYLLWLIGSIALFIAVCTPLIIGRVIIDCTIGRPLHDTYSMLLGLNVLLLSRKVYQVSSRRLRILSRYRRGLSKYALGAHPLSVMVPVLALQGAHLALLVTNGGVLLPLLAGFTVHLYVFMPFEGIFSDLTATGGLPAISLSMSWAYGLLYVSMACSVSGMIRQNWLSTMLQQAKTAGLARTAPLINKRIIQIQLRLLLLLLLPISVTFSHGFLMRNIWRFASSLRGGSRTLASSGTGSSSSSSSSSGNDHDANTHVTSIYAQAYVFRGALLSVTMTSLAFLLAKPAKKLASKWTAAVWESEYVVQRKLKNMDDTEPAEVLMLSPSGHDDGAAAQLEEGDGMAAAAPAPAAGELRGQGEMNFPRPEEMEVPRVPQPEGQQDFPAWYA